MEATFGSAMIWPVSLLYPDSISIEPAVIADCAYTGNSIEPKIIVNTKYSAWEDVTESYIVKYSNNTEPGIATITIKFNKRFSGEITREFVIFKPIDLM